jgi:hypothetical protein
VNSGGTTMGARLELLDSDDAITLTLALIQHQEQIFSERSMLSGNRSLRGSRGSRSEGSLMTALLKERRASMDATPGSPRRSSFSSWKVDTTERGSYAQVFANLDTDRDGLLTTDEVKKKRRRKLFLFFLHLNEFFFVCACVCVSRSGLRLPIQDLKKKHSPKFGIVDFSLTGDFLFFFIFIADDGCCGETGLCRIEMEIRNWT